jgi:hypothetical protein
MTTRNLTSAFIDGAPTSLTERLYYGEVNSFRVRKDRIWLLGTNPNDPALGIAAGKKAGPALFLAIHKKIVETGKFDFILLDTNPYIDTNLIMAALAVSDRYIIPVEATRMALQGASVLSREAKRLREEGLSNVVFLGFVINKYKSGTNVQQGYKRALYKKFGDFMFDTIIGNRIALEASPNAHLSIWTLNRRARPPMKCGSLWRSFGEDRQNIGDMMRKKPQMPNPRKPWLLDMDLKVDRIQKSSTSRTAKILAFPMQGEKAVVHDPHSGGTGQTH